MLGGLLLLMAIVAVFIVVRWSMANDDIDLTGKTSGYIRMRHNESETKTDPGPESPGQTRNRRPPRARQGARPRRRGAH